MSYFSLELFKNAHKEMLFRNRGAKRNLMSVLEIHDSKDKVVLIRLRTLSIAEVKEVT